MIGKNEAKIVLSAEDRTRAAFMSAQKSLSGVGQAALSVKGALATLGVGTVAAALLNGVRSAADYGDEMAKLAQRAGTTSEAISALAYAARLSDVDNEQLAKGLRELGKDAQSGGKKLAALGIAVVDSTGKIKASEVILSELADVISGLETPQQRAAAAAKVLGEEAGPKLLTMLAGGSKGLREATEEAAKFGRVVSTEASTAAEEFNDNLARMGERASGLALGLSNALLPALNEVLRAAIKLPETASLAGMASDVIALDRQLKALESRKAGPFNFAGNLDKEIEQTTAKLAEAKRLLNAAAKDRPGPVGAGRGRLNPPAIPPRRESPIVETKDPKPAKAGGGSGKAPPLTYDESITQRVGKLLEDSDVTKAREYADTLARLDSLYFSGQLGGELYDSAIKKLTGSTSEAGKASTELAEQQQRLAQLLAGTASAAMEEQRRDVELLDKALKAGTITETLYREAMEARLGIAGKPGEDSPVTSSLATSIEDGILNGFRDGKGAADIFLDELKGQFAKTVLRPLIQPLAEAGNALISGMLGSMFSFDGGGYTGNGSRSGGMDGKGGFMAMLHPQETVTDHSKGQRAGGAGQAVTVIQNFTVGDVASVAMVKQAVAGSEARIASGMGRSMRYGGALS